MYQETTRAVLLVIYSGPFLKWSREELKQIDQRTRKLMALMACIPEMTLKDYMCQEKREKDDLTALKRTLTQRLEDYIEKRSARLITATRNTMITRMEISRKHKSKEKQLYECFK